MRQKIGDALWVIFFIAYMTVALLIFTSCGSKKKTTSQTRETQTTEVVATSKTESETQNTIIKNVVITKNETTGETTTTETYSPIDPTKPASTITDDGKKIDLHNSSYTKQTKTVQATKQEMAKDASVESAIAKEKAETDYTASSVGTKTAKTLDLDKKNIPFFNWWWLLIAVIIVGGGFYLNKRFNIAKRVTGFFSA